MHHSPVEWADGICAITIAFGRTKCNRPHRRDRLVHARRLVQVQRHAGLPPFVELLLRQSGGIFEKSGNEVDFVVAPAGRPPDVIECKWTAEAFDPAGMKAFRRRYPTGHNYVVAADVTKPFTRRFGDVSVRFQAAPPQAEPASA